MRYSLISLVAAAIFAAGISIVGASPSPTVIRFASLDQRHPYEVSGKLYSPARDATAVPAVVIVHGTMGIDSRGEFYRAAILDTGIAVFEVDFKTGVYHSPSDRPSPDTFLAMGFAALKELRRLPSIDPDRIGIMGFSLGGHLAVESAFEANRKTWLGNEKGYASHVAFYPVCKRFLSRDDLRMTGAPMMILYGTEDSYGDGRNVPAFKDLLLRRQRFEITAVEYRGASHGFNRNAPALRYADPAAIGQSAYMEWNPDASNDSVPRIVDFLKRTLSVGHE